MSINAGLSHAQAAAENLPENIIRRPCGLSVMTYLLTYWSVGLPCFAASPYLPVRDSLYYIATAYWRSYI